MHGTTRTGEENPFFGKTHTNETREIISEHMKEKVVAKNILTGETVQVTKSEFDSNKNLVGHTSGRIGVDSESTRKAKGWAKGKTLEKYPCTHCGKEMALAPLTRYHNDNCKLAAL
jgi:hypothetical protein